MLKLFNWISHPLKLDAIADDSSAHGSGGIWQLSLADAVREAVALLAFASRSGKTVAPEHVKAILEISRLVNDDNIAPAIDTDREQAFWLAYSAVVTEIRPVTSDSINATLKYSSDLLVNPWFKRSIAQKTVFRYGLCSLVVLLAIMYFQTYMQMGMCIRDHLLSSFHGQKQSVDEFFRLKIKEQDDWLKAAGLEGQENMVKKLYEKYKVELQLAKLRASQDEMYSWGREGGKALQSLGMSSGTNMTPVPTDIEHLFSTDWPRLQETSDAKAVGPKQQGQDEPEMEPQTQETTILKKENALILAELQSVVIPTYIALNESEQVLRVISEFILPLLYGLLGACVYVLRDLTNTIGSVTFSKSSMINYSLRLIMGPLVGIAIGLFLGTPAANLVGGPNLVDNPVTAVVPPTIPSLGIMALAFLAGYSVEVLFSALDTLIGAFASKNSPKVKGTH